MSDSLEAQLEAGAAQLQEKFTGLFAEFLGPWIEPIKAIHSTARSEDREALIIYLDMQDGSTAILVLRPGEPISLKLEA